MSTTIAGLKASLKRQWTVDARRILTLLGTPYKLAVPYSTSEFQIGKVRFVVMYDRNKTFVKALDPIPTSWFVDLSMDIEQEEPALDFA
jgi:hypothetical protein